MPNRPYRQQDQPRQRGSGATAALTGASQVLDAVNAVKDGAASLGTWLVPVACLATMLACAYVVWERIDMRRRGIV